MEVSNKILTKLSLIIAVVVLIFGIIVFCVHMFYMYDQYKYDMYKASKEYIDVQYQSYLKYGIDDMFGIQQNVGYEVFYSRYTDFYFDWAKHNLGWFRVFLVLEIVTIILFIPVLILIIKYFKRTNKLIRHIKEYRDYMLATNSYKIEDIAKEFNEEPRLVEAYIQKAINKHILKNVYLSKQTKEVLLVNKYI